MKKKIDKKLIQNFKDFLEKYQSEAWQDSATAVEACVGEIILANKERAQVNIKIETDEDEMWDRMFSKKKGRK